MEIMKALIQNTC